MRKAMTEKIRLDRRGAQRGRYDMAVGKRSVHVILEEALFHDCAYLRRSHHGSKECVIARRRPLAVEAPSATDAPVLDGQDCAEADLPQLDGWKLEGLDFPSFRMSLVAKVMDRLTLRHMAKHTALSMAEWRALSRIASSPTGKTVGQVAELAWADRAEVSRAAASLEERKFVSRRENPADKRSPLFTLTPLGEAHYLELRAKRSDFHRMIISGLSEEDIVTMDAMLLKIARRLQLLGADPNW